MTGRLGRLGLATRIALAIVASLLAIQLLVAAVFSLTPESPPPLFGARWLADTVAMAARRAVEDPAAPLPGPEGLVLAVSRTPPDEGPARWPMGRVASTIAGLIGPGHRVIAFHGPSSRRPLPPPGSDRGLDWIVPQELSARLSDQPLRPDEEVLTPPFFTIAVELGPDRWLVATPRHSGTTQRLLRSLAFVFAGIVVIGFIAVRTSRSLLAPLSALAEAAERMGREREPTPVPRPAIPEFAAIAEAFEVTQRRLKRFIDERTQMLAAVSHDLRTPLTRLRLQTEYVADARQREEMQSNIADMQAMLEETLTFVTGDARSERTEPIDLASMLITLCDEASDSGAQARFDGPDHLVVPGRRTAVRRLFANLVENAIQYGGSVAVTLDAREGEAVAMVADDGPGIPEEMVERAFAPFQRLETSRNRDSGGTGLGLAIARDIALGHGGSITLKRGGPGLPGTGLVATVCLPRGQAAG